MGGEEDLVFYVGPVRNSTPINHLSSQPIVTLRGVDRDTTVDDLVKAWVYYTGMEQHIPEMVSYANRAVPLGVNINVFQVVQIDGDALKLDGFKKFYFCLPHLPVLVGEFLEGDEDKK